MKKAILFLLIAICISTVYGQKEIDNCTKIHQLIEKALTKKLALESKESIPTEDLEMWKATTILAGTKSCYIQDAYAYKMYVADFEYSSGNKLDERVAKRFMDVSNQLNNCLKNEFSQTILTSSEVVLKGVDYNGLGKYDNVKIQLYVIYNPADKKQTLFMSLMYDPG